MGVVKYLSRNFVAKIVTLMNGDKKVLEIHQRWLIIRDKYFLEIAEDVDVALALGLVWAVDIWREAKNN